jgi:alpha-aminoadipic semialdehyde synthase
VRRENKSVWERRVPLSPSQVKSLLSQNPSLRIIVQPSQLRVFSDQEYHFAGALVLEDIGMAEVVIGVKEIPVQYLQKGKTYM